FSRGRYVQCRLTDMTIKIVTDSTSDIPRELAGEMGITVVPVYVRFNNRIYRDGVDIGPDEFLRMLAESPHHPATSQPTPEDFENAYEEICDGVDGIVSIHVSSKTSGTCNSAAIARKNLDSPCPIEVIDSGFTSAGLALVTMTAARLAQAGEDYDTVLRGVHSAIQQTDMLGMFETMKYLARSGRVSKAIGTVASILNVMPLLTFREGEIIRAGLVRSASRGMDRLYRFVEEKENLAEVIIVHSAVPEQAEKLRKRIGWLFPEDSIRVMNLCAGIGVHGGPGALMVGVREEEEFAA
ncbi:MAG: DegV family protein, partial [Dehalococcoidales bacterium]|nr:DegV family protein [Dehalococcoidales bacterium]